MLTLDDLVFLTSQQGQNALTALTDENLADSQTLSLITRLRRDFDAQQASAILYMARLRQRAVQKFGDLASKLYFTDDALQQASDPLIRRYRARIVQGLSVVDACCGIGSDTLAMAREAQSVVGVDLDPLRIAIARMNAEILGMSSVTFEESDVTYINKRNKRF